ncbi:unnamed protein product [Didymodactylos carnosus]|uniref:Uncharacterized protein n=1 Tax=Didymodactylos carnosus TaxID=1234261 RepID=A0A814B4E8_9BILA|nr:unnamed protein product [Didymodactylos carnosus]CAF3700193.1 unnamed protein product [Didymodactylos carnosus]
MIRALSTQLVKMFRANKQVCKSVSFAIVRMIRQVIGSRLTRLILHVKCNKCFKPYEIHHRGARDNTLPLCEKCSNHPHQEVHSLEHNQIPLTQQTSITATTQQLSVAVDGNQISEMNCLRCVSLKAGLQIESEKTKYWEKNAKRSDENAKYWEKEAKHERERADERECDLLKLMDNLRKEFDNQLAVLKAKQQ